MTQNLMLFSILTIALSVSAARADGPNLVNDANTKFQSANCDSSTIKVTDAYKTYFGLGAGNDESDMVFQITVKNSAYTKNFYVKPDDQGPYSSDNLAQPYNVDQKQMTTFVYEGTDGEGNDKFAILDERVGYNTQYIYDVSVVMNGVRTTCSLVTIKQN